MFIVVVSRPGTYSLPELGPTLLALLDLANHDDLEFCALDVEFDESVTAAGALSLGGGGDGSSFASRTCAGEELCGEDALLFVMVARRDIRAGEQVFSNRPATRSICVSFLTRFYGTFPVRVGRWSVFWRAARRERAIFQSLDTRLSHAHTPTESQVFSNYCGGRELDALKMFHTFGTPLKSDRRPFSLVRKQ